MDKHAKLGKRCEFTLVTDSEFVILGKMNNSYLKKKNIKHRYSVRGKTSTSQKLAYADRDLRTSSNSLHAASLCL